MNHNVEFKGLEEATRVRKLIEDLITRIDRKTKNFPPETTFLRVMIENNSPHTLYKVSVTAEVPGKTLAAKHEGHDLEANLRRSFAEIERQVEAHKASLRTEHLWKRLARRTEIREKKISAPASEELNRQAFFELVNPHLNALHDFISHELSYAEALGDLAPGELTTEDVLDAMLLRAYQEFVKTPVQGEIRSWLTKLAMNQLDTEIKRSKSERSRTPAHVEQDVPGTPPEQAVSTLGDEILDFYQPDEDWKLEDTLPDFEIPTPEEEAEANELRRCVRESLTTMPTDYRRLLVLRHVQGLTVSELAKVTGKAESEIDAALNNAQQHLRQRLTEAGCRP
jgi:RNA polymerase sigma factor (sigma-70 family)